ncbi:MAG: hypothetical protein GWP15_02980, partial [Nitrospirae bacterium]|nr:hypothetical protein [Nitrospirota bacterium]
RSEKIIEELKSSSEFKRLIRETKEYKKFIKAQWQKNSEKVLEIIENTSGLKLPNQCIDVYITHPKLKNGFTIDNNKIAWGHSEDFLNYSTVYLCHELMHILTKHDNTDVTHAVIELLIDNELRIRLNQFGSYFQFQGHKHLAELKEKIFPEWQKFLKRDKKNIFNFIKEFKSKYMRQ